MERTVIELFAGVGGFRVGLNHVTEFDSETGRAIETNDWDFVWANQWEPSTVRQDAFQCYTTRFGNTPNHSNQNISTVDKEIIPNHSLLVGGFPCQDYSVARSLSGEQGIQGKKGVLFWDIAEILKVKDTPFVLLENVDRLLKSPAKQRGRDFGIMLRTFHDLGYNVEWRVINAADYGCAQKRRRIFIFAWKQSLRYNNTLTQNDTESIINTHGLFAQSFPLNIELNTNIGNISLLHYKDTVEMTEYFKGTFENTGVMINGHITTIKTTPNFIEPIPLSIIREKRTGLNEYFLTDSQDEKFKFLKGAKKIPRTKPNGESYLYSEGGMSYPDDLSSPGRTMLTSEASVNRSTHIIEDFETKKNRFITPVEAERLQAFPDNWTNTGMPKNRRYFMMGNALVTQIISNLEVRLNTIIDNEPEIDNELD